MVADLEFASADRRFGLRLPAGLLDEILGYCRAAIGVETGGILIGRYDTAHDCALVTQVTGPPADSRASRSSFTRGVRGLRRLVLRVWRDRGEYYVGEWHFHPGGSPNPSGIDRAQMRAFAENPAHRCPEPILVIVGGDPATDCRISASVTALGEMIPMLSDGATDGRV